MKIEGKSCWEGHIQVKTSYLTPGYAWKMQTVTLYIPITSSLSSSLYNFSNDDSILLKTAQYL